MSTTARRIIGASAVALVVAGTSYAAVAATSNGRAITYYSCVTKPGSSLVLTTKSKSCPKHERKISFNARGPRGVPGAPGAGVRLVDANKHVLGSVISATPTDVQIVTSKGFQLTLSWTGQIPQAASAQIYNTGTCAAPATYYLLASTDAPDPNNRISKSALLYISTNKTFLEPSAGSSGTVGEVEVTGKSYYAGASCVDNGFPFAGWKLAPVTRAQAGLPATITAPLAMR